jgi:hypothetical protein
MAMIGASATAQTDQKEYKTFVKNDHHVYYCTHNGVTVVVDPTVDGLFEPHITIINESGHEFLFEPKKITAQAYGLPGNTYKSTRYRVERLLEKGDTLGFEKDVLTIYTPEKYQKKASRTLWWAGLITETVIASAEAIGPQDNGTKVVNELQREERMGDYRQANSEIKRYCENYWRANTIFNGEEHEGFIAIKRIKSSHIILDIPVNGENFHFLIDNQKHY